MGQSLKVLVISAAMLLGTVGHSQELQDQKAEVEFSAPELDAAVLELAAQVAQQPGRCSLAYAPTGGYDYICSKDRVRYKSSAECKAACQ